MITIDSRKTGFPTTDAARALAKGEVVALLTDTVYGLSCLPGSAKAKKKISLIKNRPGHPSFILLVSSLAMAKKICAISGRQSEVASKIWGGYGRPSTLIFDAKSKKIPGGIAVRIPRKPSLVALIKKLKNPIISTSLNISGKEAIRDPRTIENSFEHLPDLLVYEGPAKRKSGSRIIDLRDVDNPKIIRK